MGLASRRRTRIAVAALAALILVASIDAAGTWRQHRLNQMIQSGALPATDADSPPELRFAQAYALAASGAADEALNRYQALQADPSLRQAARFNAANLLLRQAMVLREGPQPGQAIPLIELAKESLRDVLRDDPAQWDARYNLERAQRLLADPEEADIGPPEPPPRAERAVTTMRAFSPGLP